MSAAAWGRWSVGWILSVALVGAGGCTDTGAPAPGPVGEYVDLRDHLQTGTDLLALAVAHHAAGADGEGHRADRHRLAQLATEDDRLRLESEGGSPSYLEWPVDLAAASAFDVEIDFEIDVPGHVRLLWRAQGEAFDFARGLGWTVQGSGRQQRRRTLMGRPSFRGQIVEMRLQIEGAESARVELFGLRTRGWPPDLETSELLPAVEDEVPPPLPAIRFGSEVRPGFLLGPDEVVRRAIPAGRWRLRGAAVHPWSGERELRLAIERDGVELEQRSFVIPPVRPEWGGETMLWHPIEWDVEIEAAADLSYLLGAGGSDESGDEEGFVVIGALRPTPLAPTSEEGAETSPRAVLVSLDTVRRDVLGLYGAAHDPSPYLDRLGSRATVFDHAYSTSSWTLPAHVSLLTGYWPTRHGIEGGIRAYRGSGGTLARTLREAGYWTEAWTEGGFVDPRFGFAHGFDRYVVLPTYHMMEEGVRGTLASFASIEGPAFLFFHSYEAHAPYEPDREWFAGVAGLSDPAQLPSREETWAWMEAWRRDGERLPEARRVLLEQAYRAGIPRVDRLLAELLDGLEVPRLDTRDVVVVTSDHGETFQETSSHLEHGSYLYPELLAVPLVVASGSTTLGERRADVVSIADVPATILSLLGEGQVESDGAALLGPERPWWGRRSAVRASVQPPFEAEYRVARAGAGWVDVEELGSGHRVRRADRASSVAADGRPPDADALGAAWAHDHRGRTELSFRFDAPRAQGVIRIVSSSPIFDATVLPSVAGVLERRGDRELRVRLVPDRPTSWITLLVETLDGDPGWRVIAPGALGGLVLECGDGAETAEPRRCHAALSVATRPEVPTEGVGAGRLRIRRYPGRRFARSAPPAARGSSVDPALARQLEALGYAGVEVGAVATSGGGGEFAEPDRVVLVREPIESSRGD